MSLRITRIGRLLLALTLPASLAACGAPEGDGASTSEQAWATSGVAGVVDGLAVVDDQLVVRGWACDIGQPGSIRVDLYANGPAGTGKGAGSATASRPNEAAIDTICKSTGVGHRFGVPITGAAALGRAGQPLYVHGISVSGGANRLLDQSGKYAMPAHLVTGAVEKIVVVDWAPYVSGWACDLGVGRSITVELYAGGPAGKGALLRTAVANVTSDASLSAACGTTGVAHRFLVPLQPSDVRAHAGAPIHMRGRSESGGAPLALAGSGAVVIPRHMVMGNIDGVRPYAGNQAISGWACDYGVTDPVGVHVYAGGFAGKGDIAAAGTADQPSDDGVTTACGTPKGTPHRFVLPLGEKAIQTAAGRALFVHGIKKAVDSPGNLLIGRSGAESAPPYFTLGWSSYKSRLTAGAATWEVPSHLDVTLDEPSVTLPLLHVMGKVRCAAGNTVVSAQGIMLDGPQAALECGTADAPFQGSFRVTLRGDPLTGPGFDSAHACGMSGGMDHPSGPQSIVAKCGGKIRLHGRPPSVTWTRLAATAEANAKEIVLRGAVDWRVGDRIAIASTSFVGAEADDRVIAAIDRATPGQPRVTLDKPLGFRHLGATHTYSNGKSGPLARTFTLDQGAEVALLNRNIVIEGTECDLSTPADRDACLTKIDDRRNKMGGHIMATAEEDPKEPLMEIDSVELRAMGRLSKLGRYPIHWHRVGPTVGDYLTRSSIHHTFQRCVVLHGTHGVVLQDNVCFDHYGHGYMLEDGDEHDNRIVGNLGFVSRRPPIKYSVPPTGANPLGVVEWNRGLLVSDNREVTSDRWQSPATFWITNPDNVFESNVAAGSEGTGFWFSLLDRLACTVDSMTKRVHECHALGGGEQPAAGEVVVYPKHVPLSGFVGNVAHSGVVGMTHDAAARGAIATPCDAQGTPLSKESNKCNDRFIETSHYSPRAGGVPTGAAVRPVYSKLRAWRQTGSGFYFRGDGATVDESVLAETVVAAFFDYNQTLSNSLVVGLGPELAGDLAAVRQAKNRRFVATRLYDGPFFLDNVHLAGFTGRAFAVPEGTVNVRAVAIGNVGGADKSPTNHVRGLTFEGSSPPVDLSYDGGTWPGGLMDDDGSLTGAPGSTLLSYAPGTNPDGTPLMTAYDECPVVDGWSARRCPATMSFGSLTWFSPGLLVHPPNIPDEPVPVERIKRVSGTDTVVARYPGEQNKMTVTSKHAGATYRFFAGEDYAFAASFPNFDNDANCPVGSTCPLRLTFKYVKAGDRSAIVRVRLPANTDLVSVSGLASLASEAALESGAGYFRSADGRTVSVRIETATGGVLADPPFDASGTVVLQLKRR